MAKQAKETPPICPVHGRPLVCPSCVAIERGRKGGKKKTEEKSSAARKNLTKARKARRPL
jgi:hypothetical protein